MQKVTRSVIPQDILFMRRALKLARRGQGCVHPNPMVGAVLVKDGRIVGEGFHERFGGPHAEVNAIRRSRRTPKGCTLYLTLEPCSHVGKTPPCAELILKSGIKKVVIATKDPNPVVNGRGAQMLKKAGVQVTEGVLTQEARALNRDFSHWVRQRMPYGVVKIAQSLDGKIATRTGESHWISGPEARDVSQTLRAASDAVLVGVRTILQDNPYLSVRNGMEKKNGFRPPVKVILDGALRTPLHANIFSGKSTGGVILAATRRAPKNRIRLLRKKAEVLVLPGRGGRVDLKSLFKELAKRGIVSVLVEGGGETIAEALNRKLAQELYWFVAPKIIGGRGAPASVGGSGIDSLKRSFAVRQMSVRRIGEDLLVHGFLKS